MRAKNRTVPLLFTNKSIAFRLGMVTLVITLLSPALFGMLVEYIYNNRIHWSNEGAFEYIVFGLFSAAPFLISWYHLIKISEVNSTSKLYRHYFIETIPALLISTMFIYFYYKSIYTSHRGTSTSPVAILFLPFINTFFIMLGYGFAKIYTKDWSKERKG